MLFIVALVATSTANAATVKYDLVSLNNYTAFKFDNGRLPVGFKWLKKYEADEKEYEWYILKKKGFTIHNFKPPKGLVWKWVRESKKHGEWKLMYVPKPKPTVKPKPVPTVKPLPKPTPPVIVLPTPIPLPTIPPIFVPGNPTPVPVVFTPIPSALFLFLPAVIGLLIHNKRKQVK